ncbi:helix-turn-helix domain-containing protein [Mycolicibacterium sp.]|uniref:helix-turn-helix domain-containing protein n=1 Tax=Mycolicibacterium sp. TaxID=2320850 RepID=UPI003D0B2F3A
MRLHSGDTLRALMRQRGYSMAQLASAVNCSKAFIHALCSGAKQSCSPRLGVRIAEALDVPLDLLFSVEDSRWMINRYLTK